MRRYETSFFINSGLWAGALLWVCLGTCGCGSRDNTRLVQGSVIDFSGQPVTDVEITFWPIGNTQGATTFTNPGSSTFRFRCEPGEYKVTVFPFSKGKGPGGPRGPTGMRKTTETQTHSPIPEAYWKPELTRLTATIPAKGTTDLKLQLTATGQ